MLSKNIFNLLLFGCVFVKGFICLELEAYTACYGIFYANFLKPTCDSGEKMAVVGLTAFAKELSTSCPVEIIPANVDTTPDSCCQYDSVDCSVLFSTAVYRHYYMSCNGKNTCTVQVSWVNTPCNQTVYLPRTNYMKIEYYCIADQGLDPCTSLNTKDSKVFLWNSGYPTTPLSGSSSCTCSMEASCDSNIRITVIDLRFDTSGECKQSITVTEGTTSTVFDCTNNTDYLPTVLFTSTSHFIRLQIDDNLGTASGFYFILFEGTSPGAELTLSCSSSAQSNPTITVSDLPECPDDVPSTSPSGLSPDTSTSDVYSRTESTLASHVSTSTIKTSSSMSPTMASLAQTSLDTLTGSTSTGPSFTASSGNTQSTKNTETASSDSTLPTFVSLGWTSTENDVTGTLMSTDTHMISSGSSDEVTGTFMSTDTHVISSGSSEDTTGSKLSTNLATGTTTKSLGYTSPTNYGMETTSELSTGHTSLNVETTRETNDTSLGQSEKPNNISLIAVIIVLLLVAAGIIIIVILYRDKFKECCKSKSSSKTDVSVERDDDLLYVSIVNTNIENRTKPLQLPSMTNKFRASTLSNRFGEDPLHTKTDECDVPKKKKKKKRKRKDTLNEQGTTVIRGQHSNSLSTRKVNAASSETKQ